MKSVAKAVFSCFLLSAAVLGQSSTAQISGAVKDQTGALLPGAEITATQTADNKLAPSGAQGFVAYLNRAAFQNPALGTLGNMGRNNIEGPSFFNFDLALSRVFRVRESQRLEVRAEAFNVTNSLRPGNPSLSLTSPTFGVINQSATGAEPRIMQFALKYVF